MILVFAILRRTEFINLKELVTSSIALEFIQKMARRVTEEFANFEANISLDNPVGDYLKLLDEKMRADVIMPNEVYTECWRKISDAARDTIWKMLFDGNKVPDAEQLRNASKFLARHKEDACFYRAAEYNQWIVLVRDELLKRNMVDFWKTEMVEKELGPCWARDSDLFDNNDDPEPANFYNYAGCEAQWIKNKKLAEARQELDMVPSSMLNTKSPKSVLTLKKISIETPLQDYKYNMDAEEENAGDEEDVHNETFQEAREMIWYLLFNDTPLSNENFKKAADLLEEHKRDACFYCPYEYNDWISILKDELIKRKYITFWQDVVVKKELGLCWARDSDHFDDMDDPKPLEFYKVNEELLKNNN